MTNPDLDLRIQQYIASESATRSGRNANNLPAKLQRNIRRNYHVSISKAQLGALIERYQAISTYAFSILDRYLTPVPGAYADWSDVRMPEFIQAIREQFPDESPAIAETLARCAVHYGYLR